MYTAVSPPDFASNYVKNMLPNPPKCCRIPSAGRWLSPARWLSTARRLSTARGLSTAAGEAFGALKPICTRSRKDKYREILEIQLCMVTQDVGLAACRYRKAALPQVLSSFRAMVELDTPSKEVDIIK